jgi:hypothetical protein
VKLSLVDPSCCYHSFRIDGSVDGLTVCAEWDGQALHMPDELYNVAQLAEAVDSAFVEAGLWPTSLPLDAFWSDTERAADPRSGMQRGRSSRI